MAILQIRGFPKDLYELLKSEAQKERRSLSQHALQLLQSQLLTAQKLKQKKRKTLKNLSKVWKSLPSKSLDPLKIIREDRDR